MPRELTIDELLAVLGGVTVAAAARPVSVAGYVELPPPPPPPIGYEPPPDIPQFNSDGFINLPPPPPPPIEAPQAAPPPPAPPPPPPPSTGGGGDPLDGGLPPGGVGDGY